VTDLRTNNKFEKQSIIANHFCFRSLSKIHASAKGKILSADWTKLSIPLLPPLLQLQNITEIIIVRRFGSDIYLPVSAKLSKNTTLFFSGFSMCISTGTLKAF
jgi:hypothetical protein